jgi:hypothetical protein
MVDDDSKRTLHAQEAFKFSDVFGFKFQNVTFGAPPRRLKLMEPEMSTDGGRKARQSIVLAADADGARALVAGWLDVPRKVSELKSYNLQGAQYEARYGGERIDIQREEYERALAELQSFFRIQQIQTTVVEAPARPPPRDKAAPKAAESPGPTGPMIAMLALGILIGFGLGYLVFHLRIFGPSG